VQSVTHIGAAKDTEKPRDAHAWLDAAGVQVTGYPAAEGSPGARVLRELWRGVLVRDPQCPIIQVRQHPRCRPDHKSP